MTGVRDFAPDRWLDEGDRVSIGELAWAQSRLGPMRVGP